MLSIHSDAWAWETFHFRSAMDHHLLLLFVHIVKFNKPNTNRVLWTYYLYFLEQQRSSNRKYMPNLCFFFYFLFLCLLSCDWNIACCMHMRLAGYYEYDTNNSQFKMFEHSSIWCYLIYVFDSCAIQIWRSRFTHKREITGGNLLLQQQKNIKVLLCI